MKQFLLHLKNKQTHILIVLLLLASVLRLYKLNQIPYGFYWDEAAITYNAYGLAEWNRDEFGNKLPTSFKSFGDYKAPLLIYILGGIYKVTGLHPEYLRIIISLSGIGVVGLMYLLTLEYERQKILPSGSALITVFITAVTPWAIHFSRIGVEATLALLLFLVGTLSLEKSKRNPTYLFVAGPFMSLSMYSYHSAKLVVPLFVILWSLNNWRLIIKSKKFTTIALLIALVMLFPLIKDTFFGGGFERGKSLIFFNHNLNLLPQNILSFINLKFWILGIDSIGLRHGVPGFGVIPKTVFVLFLLGLITAFRYKPTRILLFWVLIGLCPSIFSTDAPHAIRAMMALPPIIFLAVKGYSMLPNIFKKISILLISIETIFYLSAYYSSYAIESSTSFQYGYKEAILFADKSLAADGKVIVTDFYGQPYIYTLLYRQLTPEEFKFGALANYEFHSIDWSTSQTNRIYVATPAEINPTDPTVIKVINIPKTDIPVFVIAKT